MRVGAGAPVYLSAVLEYMTAEVGYGPYGYNRIEVQNNLF